MLMMMPLDGAAMRPAAVIRMETRSGSNRFSGSVYNTWRNQAGTNDADVNKREKKGSWLWGLNTPYWFNKRDIAKTKAGEYFIANMIQRRRKIVLFLPHRADPTRGEVFSADLLPLELLQIATGPVAANTQPMKP